MPGTGLSFIELNMNFPEYQVHYLEYTDALKEFAEKAGFILQSIWMSS
ncbi:MAG: hypothetical protein K6B39_00050 [Lachnospiraceae bacterium]|nr:hypothetical protein [Lachnospiraceae bacterium]